MDKKRRNVIAIGALTVSAAILFVWGMYYLLGNPILRGGMDLVIMIENGAGLKRGDRVFLQGVDVGWVRGIDLTRDNRVSIDARLRGDLALPTDTRASVMGDVFGAHTVQLVPGESRIALTDGDTVSGSAVPAITELAADLGAQARTILGQADSLLSPAAVRDLQQTAAILPAGAAELQAAMAEFRLAAGALRRTIEDVERAQPGDAMTSAISEVQRSAQALTAAANGMERAAGTMEQSLGSFASVLDKIDQGDGTLGRLVNDSSLYLQFNQTLREMGMLAADIRERPSRYINLRIF